ncbi:MAG: hypothetical protein ABI665_22210 [Vicinamibacterales bacterium]
MPATSSASRPLAIALGVAAALVLARSAVFLLWEQAGFDSDQAIFGLMAKHIAEGRAFPMFIYGDQYMLAMQAWLAAPLFAIFGPSVALLKAPVVLVNIATGVLLVWVLHRDGGLAPGTALLASLFFVIAPSSLAGSLVETGGGNPEPFLYVLLLWVLRNRPLAFGCVFGIGFLHREFTLYGLTAIAGLSILDDRRVTLQRLRAVALVALGYAVVWQLVRTGYVFSTPFGPGAPITAPLGAGENLEGLAGRACWSPAAIGPGLMSLIGQYYGIPFGADDHRLSDFGVRSFLRTSVPGTHGFWPVLGAIFAAAMLRVIWLSFRGRAPIWHGRAAVGAFLLLVGLQAGVAYTIARCGQVEITTFRYALLMLYTGVGVVALFFIYEPRREFRWAMASVMVLWALFSASGHLRLVNEYVYHEPANPRRELATYLVTNGIRYARSDYWVAYATTFLSGERVVVASTDLVRIRRYQSEVEAHSQDAVTVQYKACEKTGGAEAVPGMYWVCPD